MSVRVPGLDERQFLQVQPAAQSGRCKFGGQIRKRSFLLDKGTQSYYTESMQKDIGRTQCRYWPDSG